MPKKSSILAAAALALCGYTLYSDSIDINGHSSLRTTNANDGPSRTLSAEEEEEYDLTKRIGT